MYNQSQAWSSNCSHGTNTAPFNGTGPRKDNYSHSTTDLTITFSPALSGNIIVYGGTGAGSHNSTVTDTFTLSDSSVLSSQEKYDVAPYFSTLDFGAKSGITSLVCSDGYAFYGISLDGKLLVDSGVTINSPSLASTYRANTTAGFSIVSYTGDGSAARIAHGLNGSTPDFIIKKFRSSTSTWDVWHKSLGAGKRLVLNSTDAEASIDSYQSVNSSTFDVHAGNNDNNVTMIAFCWSEIPGFSKFGIYDGNSSNDGPFVELGFRPAVLLIKRYDSTGNWIIVDSKRNPFNVVDNQLLPNLGDGDYTEAAIDLVSNGFKVRLGTSGHVNMYDFVYCAWAESPFKYSNAR